MGQYASVENALPGWSAYYGTNLQTQVRQNSVTIGSENISIFGPEYCPEYGVVALEGVYSVSLQGGCYTGANKVSIVQTGLIPAWANSLQFKASSTNGLSVTIGSQSVPFVSIGNDLYACAVSAFAGLEEELGFTGATCSYCILDAITFSPQFPPTVAAFIGSPTSGWAPLTVTFTDISCGSITNRFWDFGDGNTTNTTGTSLQHTYSAGIYSVSLTVSGLAGSDTNTKSNYIEAVAPRAPCSTYVLGWGDDSRGQADPPVVLNGVVAVAAGAFHSLALKSDGTVVGWGDNTTTPSGLSNAMAIAAGAYHNLALKSDGTVVGWGDNGSGESTIPSGLSNVVAIAAGGWHSLALMGDGTVVGWGDNTYGQSTPPTGLTGVAAIAAGVSHSLALKSDGTVVGWGYNSNGQTNVPSGLSNVVAVAAGAFHSLALKSDGTVVGWGFTAPPVGLSNVVAISAGYYHSLALMSDGTSVDWSYYDNLAPPAGLSNVVAIAAGWQYNLAVISPCFVSPPSALTATAVSWNQIDLSWTDNSNNEDGFKIERAPDSGGSPGTWAQIATVVSNVTAYSDTGLSPNTKYWYRVRAYNIDNDSRYSDQASDTTLPRPPHAPSGLTATAVSTNQINLLWTDNDNPSNLDGFKIERAPDNSGSPGTWVQIATVGADVTTYSDAGLSPNMKYWYRVRAYNTYGDSDYSNQASDTTLPLPPQAPSSLTATTVSGRQINLSWVDNSGDQDGFKIERAPSDSGPWTQIAQVLASTTGYRDVGIWPSTTYYYRVRAYNRGGDSDSSNMADATTLAQCPASVVGWGDNTYGQATPPAGLNDAAAVAGGYQSLALRSDGSVVGWGANFGGEAVPPAGLTGVVAISAGAFHSLALKSDGTVVGWGYNGRAVPPPGLTGVVAIAAGYDHSLALKSDGTIVSWDDNGQAAPPAGLVGVVAIAAGFDYSLALKSDGTVVGWGANNYGQAVPPVGLAGVVAIAAGYSHSLALKSDGTIVGWGWNAYGQVVPPAGLTKVVAIAAGFGHSLALKSDGTVVAWGYNYYGQTVLPEGLTGVVSIAAGEDHSLALISPCFVSPPSALTATAVSSNQIDLSWTNNSSNEDRFGIERAASFAGPWSQIGTVDSNVTMYSDMGVSCGQTYYYRVRSYNAVASSLYSDVASANTSPDDTDCDGLPNSWTQQYFGHPTGQASDKSRAQDDPDGDGFTNLQEFQAGTDPTNSASAFRIISVAQEGDDIRVTWATAGGRTNLVQATSDLEGGYSNISPNILITGSGDTTTNFVDAGGAANAPSRYYRIRLVP
jgi:alpha-tubulin suppressor-like RCC1 family protein